jgi:hypothetical protein
LEPNTPLAGLLIGCKRTAHKFKYLNEDQISPRTPPPPTHTHTQTHQETQEAAKALFLLHPQRATLQRISKNHKKNRKMKKKRLQRRETRAPTNAAPRNPNPRYKALKTITEARETPLPTPLKQHRSRRRRAAGGGRAPDLRKSRSPEAAAAQNPSSPSLSSLPPSCLPTQPFQREREERERARWAGRAEATGVGSYCAEKWRGKEEMSCAEKKKGGKKEDRAEPLQSVTELVCGPHVQRNRFASPGLGRVHQTDVRGPRPAPRGLRRMTCGPLLGFTRAVRHVGA